jgi:hypothetical protein
MSTQDDPVEWLRWLGTEDCRCEHAWLSLGVLYGVSFGKGWVRISTDPDCRHHGQGTP